jgi:hypothetical protein
LGKGLLDLISNEIKSELFAEFGVDVYKSPLRWEMLGTNLNVLAFQTILFQCVNLILEYNLYSRLKR